MSQNEGSDSDGNENQENVTGNHSGIGHDVGGESPKPQENNESSDENYDRGVFVGAGGAIDSGANGHAGGKEELNPHQVAVIERHIAEHYSGPVPAAKEMKQYAEIDPSFPDRMMTMAEKQQDANIRIAERLSKSEAFSVPVVAILAIVLPWGICAFCVAKGYAFPAWVSGGAGFLTSAAQIIRSIKGDKDSANGRGDDSE
jgi:uncharacterized membrane protein